MTKQKPQLEWLFHPRSIAVVGSTRMDKATDKVPHSFFFTVSLRVMKYSGEIYVVSRSAESAASAASNAPGREKTYPSLLDIPGPVDHVILCTPARAIPEVLADCVEKGVRSAGIFSSGFGESEDTQGTRLQEEIVRIARKSGLRIIGPNCMGLYCPETGLNFRADLPNSPGMAGMLSQSGGMAIRTIFQGTEKGIGFSKVVSYGNESDLQGWEILDYLAHDDATGLILVYIEGTRDGPALVRALKEASRRKPVLVLKGGLSPQGSRAASSHTGAMAGSEPIWEAALRQTRTHQVRDVSDLVDTAMTFYFLERPAGRRIALMCISGGLIVNYTDVAFRHGFEIPAFAQATKKALDRVINVPGTSCANPIDMASLFFSNRVYAPMFETLDKDPNTDLILFLIAMEYVRGLEYQYKVSVQRIVEAFLVILARVKKPLVVVIPPSVEEESRLAVERAFLKAKIPTFLTMDGALRALAARIGDPRERAVG
jgi:acyl-CoA synthetase (NDP forming)